MISSTSAECNGPPTWLVIDVNATRALDVEFLVLVFRLASWRAVMSPDVGAIVYISSAMLGNDALDSQSSNSTIKALPSRRGRTVRSCPRPVLEVRRSEFLWNSMKDRPRFIETLHSLTSTSSTEEGPDPDVCKDGAEHGQAEEGDEELHWCK